ncbi:MAG: hypothetical protein ACYCRH_08215 [Acidiferrobacteraceae bacterium]
MDDWAQVFVAYIDPLEHLIAWEVEIPIAAGQASVQTANGNMDGLGLGDAEFLGDFFKRLATHSERGVGIAEFDSQCLGHKQPPFEAMVRTVGSLWGGMERYPSATTRLGEPYAVRVGARIQNKPVQS